MKTRKDNLALTRRDALINNFAPAPSLLLGFCPASPKFTPIIDHRYPMAWHLNESGFP
jgi:hypothetical protein